MSAPVSSRAPIPGSAASSTTCGTPPRQTVAATLNEAVPDTAEVDIERRVAEGAAAAVLVDESRDAELLVVGSRGLGGFSGLLLGSVSQQCAHHAACPVVIVRSRPVVV